VNKSRIAARLMLPALFAAAVVGGAVAPASADPTGAQNPQELTRDVPSGDVGGLLGGGGGGLVGGLLGEEGLVGGLLGGLL
jgi:hypothetical protein